MGNETKQDVKPAVTAYPEHDKLGPLGARASVLDGGGDLRAALVGEFRDAVERARRAPAEVKTGAAAAVHDYRKALRRARAVLALIDDALPRCERVAIRDVLRSARRAVSAARDQAVAPEALARLTLGDAERATADAMLRAARYAAPATDEIARLLADGAERAAAQTPAIEAALPPALDWDTVADGLAATYRAGRKHLRKARKNWRKFHAWRRRTRELGYQLELIARFAGERATALRDRYDTLARELGDVVDLIMLHELIVTYGAGLDPTQVDALLDCVDDQIDTAVRTARRGGKDLFDGGGRRFARKVRKAARKDLAPPAPVATAQA